LPQSCHDFLAVIRRFEEGTPDECHRPIPEVCGRMRADGKSHPRPRQQKHLAATGAEVDTMRRAAPGPSRTGRAARHGKAPPRIRTQLKRRSAANARQEARGGTQSKRPLRSRRGSAIRKTRQCKGNRERIRIPKDSDLLQSGFRRGSPSETAGHELEAGACRGSNGSRHAPRGARQHRLPITWMRPRRSCRPCRPSSRKPPSAAP
jgi:hypothetical protein